MTIDMYRAYDRMIGSWDMRYADITRWELSTLYHKASEMQVSAFYPVSWLSNMIINPKLTSKYMRRMRRRRWDYVIIAVTLGVVLNVLIISWLGSL
jgi:hypothetical protein